MLIDDAVNIETFTHKPEYENVLKKDFSPQSNILIGIVGRIDKFKRQMDFLQAAEKIIHNSKRNVAFFIIGGIHSYPYFEKLKKFTIENQLTRNVFFTGHRKDMPQVLASLDILISLSGGSVMFEAMACAKPVISAGFTSKQNAVHIQNERTGILVTSTEIPELVNAINKLIDQPMLRMKIGRQARIWAQNNLSHTTMTQKTQRLYAKLLYQYALKTTAETLTKIVALKTEPQQALVAGKF